MKKALTIFLFIAALGFSHGATFPPDPNPPGCPTMLCFAPALEASWNATK
jgi:hypothetical protein